MQSLFRKYGRSFRALAAVFLSGILIVSPLFAASGRVPQVASRPASDFRPANELLVPDPNIAARQLPARVVEVQKTVAPSDAAANPKAALAAEPRYRLVTGAGLVLHRTDRPVSALRTVHVPGSATQLFTWEETLSNGSRQPFYAYSLNGAVPLGRVRETSYVVRLSDFQFDPIQDVAPMVSGPLMAGAENTLHLVQFLATPLPEFREAIEAAGGKVLRFLSDHTFLVEMNAETMKTVSGLPYVRWIGPYHPEYRLETALREALRGSATALAPQRYSIMVGERGSRRQNAVAATVRALGGKVDLIEPGGLRVEATLTQGQLERLVRTNDVQFIDRWGGPGELDMSNVRSVGGANYLETTRSWTGQGVRGEIFDTELRVSHTEWPTAPIIHSTSATGGSLHGTSCYGINFARGARTDVRGLLPSGQGIFFYYSESTQFGGTKSRYDINRELIDPAGPYRAVFQTSSVGSTLTTSYTTISAEVDDYLFKSPILSTQSQSNAGTRSSRPQAWAKNIVSVGGMYHYDNTNLTDDHWGGGASIGLATDGRIKPDLSFYYDNIDTASGSTDTSYTDFGGTSAATPETAGHFGLLHQMWHEGTWAGHGGKADVFTSRPNMATAKALMINNAYRYNWTAGGSNGDLDRAKQGWGRADLQRLYTRASVTSVIDETDILKPLGMKSYNVSVGVGQTELNVTMAYTDPMGTVGAARARINDLSLRVTSPSGVVYWGNNGLTAGNWSTSGGSSNIIDTVENVFIQNPAAGTWKVDVFADEVVQDAHTESPEVDIDYGLVVSGGTIIKGAEIGLPAFGSTYTSSSTRGYFFTAPTNFVITGLQVPNEPDQALQHVEVVRFNPGITPPLYSANTNEFTSLFRAVNLNANETIGVSIPVLAGDVIGILGATGNSTTLYNSYGSGPYTTSILGQPVTLQRLGMQYNLSTVPARELWTEANLSIARVRMFYSAFNEAAQPAFSSTFSAATLSRGYWFTAPTDFVITGLQVPNETGHALQNVQVVRFNPGTTPTTWPTLSNTFTSLLRSVSQPSSQIVRSSILVREGDVIGILGTNGDSTMMHTSYGAGPFTSSILGESVTLNRLGMQFNLNTTSARDLYTEGTSLGRVRLFYVKP